MPYDRPHRVRRWWRLAACATVLVVSTNVPGIALGWANGPTTIEGVGVGFGTHDWVAYRANVIAQSRGVTWVDITTAMSTTDDPDTVYFDMYYHECDLWETPEGGSPTKVAQHYANAVSSLRAGDTAAASRSLGLIAHYYADTCNPLHTESSFSEELMHLPYELAVDDTTTAPESLSAWIVDDGYQACADPVAFTQQAATAAHPYYAALVSGYSSGGLSAVESITRPRLDYAVNGLADIIVSIQADAFPSALATTSIYRFYNNRTGTHFYTDSAEEKQAVIDKWPTTFTYEGVAYSTYPANNTAPLYRFYNRVNGSHFYTASAEEAAMVQAKWPDVFSFDGPTYAVNLAPVSHSLPVYRFYNKTNGSHFYTASAEEADAVKAKWPKIYEYEGVAFWVGQ